jgi:peroxiredoxin
MNIPKIAINTPAPDFVLPDFTGQIVRLSDFLGLNALLVFNQVFT